MSMVKTTFKRFKFDFYPTPPSCVSAIFDDFKKRQPHFLTGWWDGKFKVLDAGAGTGIWGKVLKKKFPNLQFQLWGVDIQNLPNPKEYDYWLTNHDFLSEQGHLLITEDSYDMVMGNPPYKYAEEFVRKSLDLTKDGGYVIMLVRLAFLESIKRGTGLFKEVPPLYVSVLSRRPSFHQDGKTGSLAYCVVVWKKGTNSKTELAWLNWNYDSNWDYLRIEARQHLEKLGVFDEHLES